MTPDPTTPLRAALASATARFEDYIKAPDITFGDRVSVRGEFIDRIVAAFDAYQVAGERALVTEISRWQAAIRAHVIRHSGAPDDRIDGGGCDSGDPLDVSLAEIGQGFAWFGDALDALRKFKAYVHDRLDKMGIPVDPDSPHKAEGCRIGGRLDIVGQSLSALDASRAESAAWQARAERAEALALADLAYAKAIEDRNYWESENAYHDTEEKRRANAALDTARAALVKAREDFLATPEGKAADAAGGGT